MADAIERAVERALPRWTVADGDHRTTRPGNETARVTFRDAAPVYVKTATDGSDRLVRETTALRYAADHCDVGVPSVVAAEPDGDLPFLVTEPLAGTPFNDRWTGDGDLERLRRRFGEVVAGAHVAEFERPGAIVGSDADALALDADTWTGTLVATIEWRVVER